MIIQTKAYPRIGLIGNPSDGYFGKTIAFTFSNFSASVTLYETPELAILPASRDHSTFASVEALTNDVRLFGYYGGIRLLKATIKRFHDYCTEKQFPLHGRNFTIRYSSDIPHLVGLAGSSAIIAACMRALMEFYGVEIDPPILAGLMLSVETDELRIAAGLQDRVVQAYQGLVYMDFDKELMDTRGYGRYELLDPNELPPLYMAYRTDLAEVSGIYHSNLRRRYLNGEERVLSAINTWRNLTDTFRHAMGQGATKTMARALNKNFDTRETLAQINPANLQMVQAARNVGASAKFTGSGGAIVGTYTDQAMFDKLEETLAPDGIQVIKPCIVSPSGA
jgi:glucuronokinase